jgi:alcohol dehydrogenase class IV
MAEVVYLMQFEYYNPVRLVFGRGKINTVGSMAKPYGKKALIVTSGSSGRTGVLQKVIDSLQGEGLQYAVFDKVRANPLTTTVSEGAALAKAENCEIVVGLGGGSAMDAAKAIAFMAVNEGDVSDYIFGKPGKGALPVILATTTAGTGSEGNSVAVLTNPENKDKKGLKSPYIYPKVAIVDPELLVTLPKRSIAGPGLDALFHAVESYLSRRSTPFSEMMALQAIQMLTANLEIVYQDPSNLDAWEKVSLANTLAGMAIDISGTALPHAMEHPVSGLLDVAHGEGLAALFIPILQFTYPSAPERFAAIAHAMGENIGGLNKQDAALRCISRIQTLLTSLDMTPGLHDFGVSEEHLDWLTANAWKTMKPVVENNPQVPTTEEMKDIYRQCL